jgi:hypothetical protein
MSELKKSDAIREYLFHAPWMTRALRKKLDITKPAKVNAKRAA